MVASVLSSPAHGVHDDGQEAITAVEELIAEFGLRGLVSACLRSSAGEQFERAGSNTSLRMAQVLLSRIIEADNARLEAEVMAVGAGILLEDNATMTRLAVKYGFTKQAFSKRVIQFCEETGLEPSCYMRSRKDRATYRLTNQPRSA